MAMFIRVDIDESVQSDPALCKQVAEVCPVDIFRLDDTGRLDTVDEHLDECTLCDLCTELAPERITVVKLYRDSLA
jgi:NAD-dependent dihydropyrimidine dehydrogenase PreA subunit